MSIENVRMSFDESEITEIERLIDKKCHSDKDGQKKIRNRLRSMGLHWDTFAHGETYNVENFRKFIKAGIIRVKKDGNDAQVSPICKDIKEPLKLNLHESNDFPFIASKVDSIKDALSKCGFEGFVTVEDLLKNIKVVPKEMGVYLIVQDKIDKPHFLTRGTGGFFNKKDPNVSIETLKSNWVEDTNILYIGKAGGIGIKTHLHRRLSDYMRFGKAAPVGHRGGRYIWQLENSCELIVCWKVLQDKEPKDIEGKMIQAFKAQHNGKRPFANLKDGEKC